LRRTSTYLDARYLPIVVSCTASETN
jgi:hypothetical protein